jgi:SAM-dependent methyltransferase
VSSLLSRAIARWLPLLSFSDSQRYWRQRYRMGGDSGAGSRGAAAAYKARVLNAFVDEQKIASVVEFGCGDGRQLEHARYPSYVGVDISSDAVRLCRESFREDATKRFVVLDDYEGEKADLALSLDVVFHLVEDVVYDSYLRRLFLAAERFVVIYSSDTEEDAGTLRHVRHRNVSTDVAGRFSDFVRMEECEALLPEPVENNRGIATQFLFYRHVAPS